MFPRLMPRRVTAKMALMLPLRRSATRPPICRRQRRLTRANDYSDACHVLYLRAPREPTRCRCALTPATCRGATPCYERRADERTLISRALRLLNCLFDGSDAHSAFIILPPVRLNAPRLLINAMPAICWFHVCHSPDICRRLSLTPCLRRQRRPRRPLSRPRRSRAISPRLNCRFTPLMPICRRLTLIHHA